jgi:hypothetical protein
MVTDQVFTYHGLAGPAIFLFLAAAVVAVFAFCSIVVWVTVPARERQARDRLALLKALAENPGENAQKVLEWLREEDARRVEKKEREERRGYLSGGLISMAAGVGLGAMLITVGHADAWSVGLIPFLIGCVLLGLGLFGNGARKEVK